MTSVLQYHNKHSSGNMTVESYVDEFNRAFMRKDLVRVRFLYYTECKNIIITAENHEEEYNCYYSVRVLAKSFINKHTV